MIKKVLRTLLNEIDAKNIFWIERKAQNFREWNWINKKSIEIAWKEAGTIWKIMGKTLWAKW